MVVLGRWHPTFSDVVRKRSSLCNSMFCSGYQMVNKSQTPCNPGKTITAYEQQFLSLFQQLLIPCSGNMEK
jgi:hypothetical protein